MNVESRSRGSFTLRSQLINQNIADSILHSSGLDDAQSPKNGQDYGSQSFNFDDSIQINSIKNLRKGSNQSCTQDIRGPSTPKAGRVNLTGLNSRTTDFNQAYPMGFSSNRSSRNNYSDLN